VKTHINNIFAKTSIRDRAQAAHYAYRHVRRGLGDVVEGGVDDAVGGSAGSSAKASTARFDGHHRGQVGHETEDGIHYLRFWQHPGGP